MQIIVSVKTTTTKLSATYNHVQVVEPSSGLRTFLWMKKNTSTSVGTDLGLYPHMPILHNAQNHYPWAAEHARWPIRLILGFWGSKVPPKCVIACLGRRQTAEQNLTPLALSSAEKSVTVQTLETHTHKIKKTNSKWYIHTMPIGMCG